MDFLMTANCRRVFFAAGLGHQGSTTHPGLLAHSLRLCRRAAGSRSAKILMMKEVVHQILAAEGL